MTHDKKSLPKEVGRNVTIITEYSFPTITDDGHITNEQISFSEILTLNANGTKEVTFRTMEHADILKITVGNKMLL